ncbi:PadR family transcriptional regulator [Natrinema thermotolerans]|uniref:PadR family transcriptional regulator n=1 Tax=Natrinema thermotolerans TaxID=121872 RepID=UPI000A05BFCE|nr:PadR family transcriptional regulator [Natrinema thermotolerans]QCC57335.1 PadR family transcriptional regulator [Natrinema thermotolerans]
MQTDTNDTDKRNATSQSTRNSSNEDIQSTAVDLTKFQVRILAILTADDRYGLAVKEELSAYYGEEINHGRLYPNLDKLVDQDLVEKSELDKRTNNYSVTDRGQRALAHETEWLEDQISEVDGE